MSNAEAKQALVRRLRQAHGDANTCVQTEAYPYKEEVGQVYSGLWKEAKEVMGEQPPLPDSLAVSEGTAEEIIAGALILIGQLLAWVGEELRFG